MTISAILKEEMTKSATGKASTEWWDVVLTRKAHTPLRAVKVALLDLVTEGFAYKNGIYYGKH